MTNSQIPRDGLVIVAKRDCPTCVMVEPVMRALDRAGPLTETILLGNLAVWAAATGGPNGGMGEWGEKVEWDARNLKVTNLASIKLLEKTGFKREGYARAYLRINGVWQDHLLFALLESDPVLPRA